VLFHQPAPDCLRLAQTTAFGLRMTANDRLPGIFLLALHLPIVRWQVFCRQSPMGSNGEHGGGSEKEFTDEFPKRNNRKKGNSGVCRAANHFAI
jgi:hypothetical protein